MAASIPGAALFLSDPPEFHERYASVDKARGAFLTIDRSRGDSGLPGSRAVCAARSGISIRDVIEGNDEPLPEETSLRLSDWP